MINVSMIRPQIIHLLFHVLRGVKKDIFPNHLSIQLTYNTTWQKALEVSWKQGGVEIAQKLRPNTEGDNT